MWQSADLQKNAKAEVRRAADGYSRIFDVSYEYATLGEESRYIYMAKILLTNAAENYSYRIVCENAASDWCDLPKITEDTLRMLVFCDTQCVDYNVWRSVFKAAVKKNDAPVFTVIGDLTDNGQAPWQWRGFFAAVQKELPAKIFAPVMGNHECYDLNWKNSVPKGYLQEFTAPANGSTNFPGYYYAFDMGPVRFIVLNTQWEELDGIKSGIVGEQKIWLKQVATRHDKPWQVVLMHKDILTYGTGKFDAERGGINDVGKAFMPLFDALGIDLVLTGHEHTYRNRGQIVGGKAANNGPVYVMCGLAGDQRYPGLWKNPDFDKVLAPQPETDNYLILTATKDVLRLCCYLPNGKKIDEVVLKKAI